MSDNNMLEQSIYFFEMFKKRYCVNQNIIDSLEYAAQSAATDFDWEIIPGDLNDE